MDGCNVYESRAIWDVTGQTLRPGGFELTKKAINFCNITNHDKVLDLGCGKGATISYLYEFYHIKAVGIDPSQKLLDIAKHKCGYAELLKGYGENLPFHDKSFDIVFAECTLSLMNDLEMTIYQVQRVLKNGGWFVITDVYARKPNKIIELSKCGVNSCMSGLHNLELLQKKLKDNGFEIAFLQDCSQFLKQLMVKIIFAYGSMDAFWQETIDEKVFTGKYKFHDKLTECKPGYFILIGKKGDVNE